MKIRNLLFLLCLLASTQVLAGKKLRVLFIGNSYITTNNMPQIVEEIAKANGDTLEWQMEAPGGYSFLAHIVTNPPNTINKIKEGSWDYVILQQQSISIAIPDDDANTVLFPYARRLDTIINNHNSCAETMFYMTWGRKHGDTFYCDYYTTNDNWPYFCTYLSMDSVVRERYRMLADSNNAIISPVGAVWRYIREKYSGIELYDADESHPSPAGSYAAACSFYTALFRRDVTNVNYDYSLNKTDAANIRIATKKVVYDSMLYWHIGEYKVEASFSHAVLSNNTNFTNNSTNGTSYTWYFGDGQTSTAANPTHTYSQPGQYTAMLVADNASSACSDTAYATVDIFPASVNGLAGEERFTIFPNPNNGSFVLQLPTQKTNAGSLRVYNVLGKEVYHASITDSRVRVTLGQPTGVYLVKVDVGDEVITRRVFVTH